MFFEALEYGTPRHWVCKS